MQPTKTSTIDSPPYRNQFQSYADWHKQARRYIKRTTPGSMRIFIRNTKPGNNWRRFVLPFAFVALGILLLSGGWMAHQEYRQLTGPNGSVGNLPVVSTFVEKPRRGNAYDPVLRLVVRLDNGQTATVRGYGNEDTTAVSVGDTIRVFYATGDTPIARWVDNNGSPSNGASVALAIFGSIVIVGAIWILVVYRGTVTPQYFTYALAELEANRTPAVPVRATTQSLEF